MRSMPPARRSAAATDDASPAAPEGCTPPTTCHAGGDARDRAPHPPRRRHPHRALARPRPRTGGPRDLRRTRCTQPGGIVLFASSRYPIEALEAALVPRCEGLTLIGCTSSSEITEEGFSDGALVAIGFPRSDFALSAIRFDALDRIEAGEAQERVRSLVAEAGADARRLGDALHRAAIFLVDGLSHSEEMLTVNVQDALGAIPLIGGSSGDGFAFRETFVLDNRGFHATPRSSPSLSSPRPMRVFRSQPYAPGDTKMVITGADTAARIVSEINADPRRPNMPPRRRPARGPQPRHLRLRPPMVREGGEHYVRSIQSPMRTAASPSTARSTRGWC